MHNKKGYFALRAGRAILARPYLGRYMQSMFESKLAVRKFLACLLILFSLDVSAASEKIVQRNISGDNYQLLEDSGVKLFLSVLNGTNSNGGGKTSNVQISVSLVPSNFPELHSLRYTTQSSNSFPTNIPIDFSDMQAVFSVTLLELKDAQLNFYFDFSQRTNEEIFYYQVNLLDVAKIQSKNNSRLHSELLMHGLLE